MSGYYRPTPRVDAVLLGGPAAPVIGDILRYTVSPAVGALVTPLILMQLFAPAQVSRRFLEEYPIPMSLRPSQLRASAAESELMIPCAAALNRRLQDLFAQTPASEGCMCHDILDQSIGLAAARQVRHDDQCA